MEGNPDEPRLAQEDRADPHRHIALLYVIAILVSAAVAFAFK